MRCSPRSIWIQEFFGGHLAAVFKIIAKSKGFAKCCVGCYGLVSQLGPKSWQRSRLASLIPVGVGRRSGKRQIPKTVGSRYCDGGHDRKLALASSAAGNITLQIFLSARPNVHVEPLEHIALSWSVERSGWPVHNFCPDAFYELPAYHSFGSYKVASTTRRLCEITLGIGTLFVTCLHLCGVA